MARQHDAVYATLVMTDSYLPGAMVLGHSLRDRGAKARLAALVLLEKLSLDTVSELQTVYDDIVPVEQIVNMQPANLYLMNRPDLISTFTKIELWKQTQYKRIVYLDADMVAIRAPNELLTLETDFAAAPDVGWPDCFNSGMMVLNPNMSDYYSLLALARRGISFDGADQGLLNMHFTDWHRLSFVYNCTPNANYQYVPAYRHFQSSISMIHFIGAEKPWTQGRDHKFNTGVYGELLARWWAIYDRHYRQPKPASYNQFVRPQKKVQDYVRGEETRYEPSYSSAPSQPQQASQSSYFGYQQPPPQAQPPPGIHVTSPQGDSAPMERPFGDQPGLDEKIQQEGFKPTSTQEQRRWSAPHAEWEPARQPPPTHSKPEAANFPSQQYEFNESKSLFEPPASYPEPPKDMWYDVPEKPKPEETKPKMIFPWEERAPKPTRVFPKSRESTPPLPEPNSSKATNSAPTTIATTTEHPITAQTVTSPLASIPGPRTSISGPVPPQKPPSPPRHIFPWESRAPKATRVFYDDPATSPSITSPQSRDLSSSTTVATSPDNPRGSRPPDNPWDSFAQQTNRWDETPEITRYMESLNKPRKAAVQVLLGGRSQSAAGDGPPPVTERRTSLRLTDFPTEVERPSLPVTPAPIRRSAYFGGEPEDEQTILPIAKGVPRQEEWVRRFTSQYLPAVHNPVLRDIGGVLHLTCQHCGKQNPVIKLEELQRRQSLIMTGEDSIEGVPTPPKRLMPESQSAEQAIEAAVKAMNIASRPKTPTKPILREPHFEVMEGDDNEIATNETIVLNSHLGAHTTATGSRSPIRFNPIVLEGEAVSGKNEYDDTETNLEDGASTATHHSTHAHLPRSSSSHNTSTFNSQETLGDDIISPTSTA